MTLEFQPWFPRLKIRLQWFWVFLQSPMHICVFSLVHQDPKKNYISSDNQRRELNNYINDVNMDNEMKIRPKREYKDCLIYFLN